MIVTRIIELIKDVPLIILDIALFMACVSALIIFAQGWVDFCNRYGWDFRKGKDE